MLAGRKRGSKLKDCFLQGNPSERLKTRQLWHENLHISCSLLYPQEPMFGGVNVIRFGNIVSEVKAPYDGIVIGFWSLPVILPGEWSYLYGKILT